RRGNQGNNNFNRKINNQTPSNKRHEPTKVYAAAPVGPTDRKPYTSTLPYCSKCDWHHTGTCAKLYKRCKKRGHEEKECRFKPTDGNPREVECWECGAKGHTKNQCPKLRDGQNNQARGRVYQVVANAQQNLTVVAGVSYEVELADGNIVSTNTVLQGCTLELLNHEFKIDLLPTCLGSFDVIVGMDWLARYHVVIICNERIVRIPLPDNHILDIYGERPNDYLNSLSCVKAVEKKPADIRVAYEFPEVFPDDFSGLPPICEVEFRIDLFPGALPIAKAPYRLAPSEMSELSNQLR
nr:hypothetical protein [Tanacetum cinerariifolium]